MSQATGSQETGGSSGGGDGSTAEEQDSLFDQPVLPEEGLLEAETWVALGRHLLASFIDYLPRLLTALLLLAFFYLVSRAVAKVLSRALSRSEADPDVRKIVTRLTTVAILVVGTLMAASQAGLAVGSLLASVGILGLAVGFAAQDSLANVIAGLIILWDRPFRVGDRVTIADEYGRVTDVGLRTTTIETVRCLEAILPNHEVISRKIINHTRTPQLRVDVPVGIGYGEDVGAAREALLGCIEGHEEVLDDPPPKVVLRELGDSSVNLRLRVWLRRPEKERAVTWDLLERSKKALDEAGIEIPFPQRTLHMAADSAPLPLSGAEPEAQEPDEQESRPS